MNAAARIACVALLTVQLAACGEKSGDEANDVSAGGEILKRSVADDMLPYDTIKSHPPLARPATAEGDTAASAEDEPGAEQGEAETQAADQPVSEPEG